MAVINRIAAFEAESTAWRRRLHEIPELDFDLFETSAFVLDRLREIGVDEIHEGIAKTGIVALIRGRAEGPVIGLRADMDALPILEAVDRPWKSTKPGAMHACGHDGHTTILLTAARYLAETRNFAGTVALIFQPSEELSGGARVMVEEGVMERFGVTRIFGLHNVPGVDLGRIETRPGAIMAASDQFEITLTGRGGHAAFPHDCIDPVAAALSLGQALLAIPARRVDPVRAGVLSLTVIRAGEATNVVPATAHLGGTVRTLDAAERQTIADAVATATSAIGAAFGVEATLDYEFGYPVTRNDPDEVAFAARVAREVVGETHVDACRRPEMGSEDFAYMLEARPGAYVFVGAGPGAGLHHPAYDYNDAVTPIGASFFARLVETALPLDR
ncbi:M20 aminoacylase family protein [Amaricoccus sp.]|uniref:M20 aminoacylase family protein n=1 Tax=Amaricoccus sp. TaxID=1872485 RepID=UPI001B770B2F|nr:M20 aminoacylase family protein [Amaricoccus sp.]MBP7002653.1 amidohydrolase [Amaricoccus sp.]